jgi:hypothetical protein
MRMKTIKTTLIELSGVDIRDVLKIAGVIPADASPRVKFIAPESDKGDEWEVSTTRPVYVEFTTYPGEETPPAEQPPAASDFPVDAPASPADPLPGHVGRAARAEGIIPPRPDVLPALARQLLRIGPLTTEYQGVIGNAAALIDDAAELARMLLEPRKHGRVFNYPLGTLDAARRLLDYANGAPR